MLDELFSWILKMSQVIRNLEQDPCLEYVDSNNIRMTSCLYNLSDSVSNCLQWVVSTTNVQNMRIRRVCWRLHLENVKLITFDMNLTRPYMQKYHPRSIPLTVRQIPEDMAETKTRLLTLSVIRLDTVMNLKCLSK